MDTLNTYQFLKIIVDHSNDVEMSITALKINQLSAAVTKSNIKSKLSNYEFDLVESDYPSLVQKTITEIKIRNTELLRAELGRRLRYFSNDEFENIVWTIWSSIK